VLTDSAVASGVLTLFFMDFLDLRAFSRDRDIDNELVPIVFIKFCGTKEFWLFHCYGVIIAISIQLDIEIA
jgi:hypothetical protein